MRIIGGNLKRRTIIAPAKLDVRPTTDMAKEALFNILNNYFDFSEISVLDLFAGIGSISYEFASREAQSVTSVDANPQCIAFIKQTADKFQLENLQPVKSDSLDFLERCKLTFDIIFADPPYNYESTEKIPEIVFRRKLLKPEAMLIIEHPAAVNFSENDYFFEKRKYGKVNFSFFKMKGDDIKEG